MEDQPKVMNYDPNLCYSGRMAKQTVRLTFGVWEYRATMDVQIGGNCRGWTVIDTAVDAAFEKLPGGDYPRIVLTKADGSELECSDDEDRCEDWLKDMLISAEILSIEPDVEATRRWRGG